VDATTAALQLKVYNGLWNAVNDHYVYTDFNGHDWKAIGATYQALVKKGLSQDDFYLAMERMIAELGDDHSHFESPAEVAAEKEQLVFKNGTTQRSPKLVQVEWCLLALRWVGKVIGEKRIGIERVVAKVFPGTSVEIIGPSLGHQIRDRSRAVAKLGRVVQGQQLKLLHRVLNRLVNRPSPENRPPTSGRRGRDMMVISNRWRAVS